MLRLVKSQNAKLKIPSESTYDGFEVFYYLAKLAEKLNEFDKSLGVISRPQRIYFSSPDQKFFDLVYVSSGEVESISFRDGLINTKYDYSRIEFDYDLHVIANDPEPEEEYFSEISFLTDDRQNSIYIVFDREKGLSKFCKISEKAFAGVTPENEIVMFLFQGVDK